MRLLDVTMAYDASGATIKTFVAAVFVTISQRIQADPLSKMFVVDRTLNDRFVFAGFG